jgi:hypothetical protein
MAVRDYTTSNLQPLLTHRSRANTTFHTEGVPAFGATTALSKLRQAPSGVRLIASFGINRELRAPDSRPSLGANLGPHCKGLRCPVKLGVAEYLRFGLDPII